MGCLLPWLCQVFEVLPAGALGVLKRPCMPAAPSLAGNQPGAKFHGVSSEILGPSSTLAGEGP